MGEFRARKDIEGVHKYLQYFACRGYSLLFCVNIWGLRYCNKIFFYGLWIVASDRLDTLVVQNMGQYLGSENFETHYLGFVKTVPQYLKASKSPYHGPCHVL